MNTAPLHSVCEDEAAQAGANGELWLVERMIGMAICVRFYTIHSVQCKKKIVDLILHRRKRESQNLFKFKIKF